MKIYTVSAFNRQVRDLLETDVGTVTVSGEISNLSVPASGHCYFTLKDATAQLRCVFFKHKHHPDTRGILKDGQQVELTGAPSLYEARGDFQLIVQAVKDAGLGNLYRQFEALKIKLSAQGLFDTARKRALPRYPTCIGIITSSTGAAIRDIVTTFARRYPLATLRIYPCEVQGVQATPAIINALHSAIIDKRAEVLILARGGGSIEDLWGFNTEALALAMSASPIPIITGIGHETDFTIADFVADHRAATPTAAAEMATPHQLELLAYLKQIHHRLAHAIHQRSAQARLRLQHANARLKTPERLLQTQWQRLDYLEKRLNQTLQAILKSRTHHLHILQARLYPPIRANLSAQQLRFKSTIATLHAVSPFATLTRGYAIATYRDEVLRNSTQVKLHDRITVQLFEGNLDCEIKGITSC